MDFFKGLGFVLFFLAGTIYASDIDNAIRKNEAVINALQDKLGSMQSDTATKDLQDHIDEVIQKQNELLAKKASGASLVETQSDTDLDARIRRITKEELAKQHSVHAPASNNPYVHSRVPTEAEQRATKEAEAHAPQLQEQKSEAIGQYDLALAQYNKAAYQEAAAGFGRIIRVYSKNPKDPIVAKALVHLAYCLEKQGKLTDATIVAESALQKELDDIHQAECQLIRLRNAKDKGNDADVAAITKILRGLNLTDEQKSAFNPGNEKKIGAPKKSAIKGS